MSRLYCELPHPGSDDDAEFYCARYHRPTPTGPAAPLTTTCSCCQVNRARFTVGAVDYCAACILDEYVRHPEAQQQLGGPIELQLGDGIVRAGDVALAEPLVVLNLGAASLRNVESDVSVATNRGHTWIKRSTTLVVRRLTGGKA